MLSSPTTDAARDAMIDGLANIEAARFGTEPAELLVEFTEIDEGRWFTAAEQSSATVVTGTVPSGTTQAERAELMDEIGRAAASALDQDFNDIMVVASDGRRGR